MSDVANGTAAGQPAGEDLDLRASLEAAIDAADTTDTGATDAAPDATGTETGAEATQTQTLAKPGERTRDASGRFVRAADGSQQQQQADVGQQGATATQAAGPVEPPAHWPEDAKAKFKALTPEAQGFLLERHKAMEADYTRKTQAIAPLREFEPVAQMFAPYRQQLASQGLTPATIIQRWASMEQALSNPQTALQAIRNIVRAYNIDVAQLTGNGEQHQQYVDPEIKSLKDELAALKRESESRQRTELAAKQDATLSEMEAFAQQKDGSGNLAHPHFDEVIADMTALAHAERMAGRQPKLQDLYDRAVWANPTTRAKLTAAQQAAAAKKAHDEAMAKSKRANTAGASVSGSPNGSGAAPASEEDLRTTIARLVG